MEKRGWRSSNITANSNELFTDERSSRTDDSRTPVHVVLVFCWVQFRWCTGHMDKHTGTPFHPTSQEVGNKPFRGKWLFFPGSLVRAGSSQLCFLLGFCIVLLEDEGHPREELVRTRREAEGIYRGFQADCEGFCGKGPLADNVVENSPRL